MTPYAARLWTCVILPAAGVGCLWIHSHFDTQRVVTAARHAQEAVVREQDWAREKAARGVEALEARGGKGRESYARLVAAAGGPADLAIKDPNLSLLQMFERLGAACAPAGSMARVTVEHFTEFTLTFESESPPDPKATVDTVLCLLPRCAPYLQALRFSQRRTLVAELDHPAIVSVPDWSTVDATRVQSLIRWESATSPALGVSGGVTKGAAESDEGADPALAAAIKAYREVFKAHEAVLNGVIAYQTAASNLKETHLGRLREKVTGLAQSMQSLGASKGFFADPALELDRALRGQGMDDLYTQIAVRGERERMRPIVAGWSQAIAAVEAHNQVVKAFLEAMIQQWGSWMLQADGETIVLTRPSARDAFEKHNGLVRIATERLDRAMERLNATVPW